MKSSRRKTLFSWKNFIIAMVAAGAIDLFFSVASGARATGSGVATFFWIYLSLEAWKVWRWKAFLPYPAFIVVSVLLLSPVWSTGGASTSVASLLFIMAVLNIIGLVIFYCVLQKAREDQPAQKNLNIE